MEEMREITLKKNHKHGSVQYYAGQTVMLPKDVVEYINGVFVANRAPQVAPTPDSGSRNKTNRRQQ